MEAKRGEGYSTAKRVSESLIRHNDADSTNQQNCERQGGGANILSQDSRLCCWFVGLSRDAFSRRVPTHSRNLELVAKQNTCVAGSTAIEREEMGRISPTKERDVNICRYCVTDSTLGASVDEPS